ncbi:hypothetical protein HDU76_003838 [Blyttiomyces sp. JEL0837]|nr:hypothetical protein HDU76_003838 [Blyttiomyces sp. JEL0837]
MNLNNNALTFLGVGGFNNGGNGSGNNEVNVDAIDCDFGTELRLEQVAMEGQIMCGDEGSQGRGDMYIRSHDCVNDLLLDLGGLVSSSSSTAGHGGEVKDLSRDKIKSPPIQVQQTRLHGIQQQPMATATTQSQHYRSMPSQEDQQRQRHVRYEGQQGHQLVVPNQFADTFNKQQQRNHTNYRPNRHFPGPGTFTQDDGFQSRTLCPASVTQEVSNVSTRLNSSTVAQQQQQQHQQTYSIPTRLISTSPIPPPSPSQISQLPSLDATFMQAPSQRRYGNDSATWSKQPTPTYTTDNITSPRNMYTTSTLPINSPTSSSTTTTTSPSISSLIGTSPINTNANIDFDFEHVLFGALDIDAGFSTGDGYTDTADNTNEYFRFLSQSLLEQPVDGSNTLNPDGNFGAGGYGSTTTTMSSSSQSMQSQSNNIRLVQVPPPNSIAPYHTPGISTSPVTPTTNITNFDKSAGGSTSKIDTSTGLFNSFPQSQFSTNSNSTITSTIPTTTNPNPNPPPPIQRSPKPSNTPSPQPQIQTIITTTPNPTSKNPTGPPYACPHPTCPASKPPYLLPRASSLRAHLSAYHSPHTNVLNRPYPCPTCLMSFRRRHDLLRHLRGAGHRDERGHRCAGCGAGFSRSDALGKHLRRCRGVGGVGGAGRRGDQGGQDDDAGGEGVEGRWGGSV